MEDGAVGLPYWGIVASLGRPLVLGPASEEAALMSCNEPLAGPGPLGPADSGRPVSAIVGVTAGGPPEGLNISDGETALGIGMEGAVDAGAGEDEKADWGIGAGDWFKVRGLIGGELMGGA